MSLSPNKTKISLRIYRLLSYSSQPKKKKKRERKGIFSAHGIKMNKQRVPLVFAGRCRQSRAGGSSRLLSGLRLAEDGRVRAGSPAVQTGRPCGERQRLSSSKSPEDIHQPSSSGRCATPYVY